MKEGIGGCPLSFFMAARLWAGGGYMVNWRVTLTAQGAGAASR